MATSSPAPTKPTRARPCWIRTLASTALLATPGLSGCLITPDPLACAAWLAPFPAPAVAVVDAGTPDAPANDAGATARRPTTVPDGTAWEERVPSDGDTDFAAGVGFTGSPNTFLLGAQVDYYVQDEWALGMVLQVGASDKDAVIAPSLNLKRIFEPRLISEHEAQPFLQGGVGIAFMDEAGSDWDSGLMFNAGGGAEMFVKEGLTLRTTLMANYLPRKVLGESWFFSWQVLQIQIRF